MHIFRAYGLPLLVMLPMAIALGLLGSFLIPLVKVQPLRLLLFLLMCLGSVVVFAFVLHHMPDHTLDAEEDDKADEVREAKPK